MTLSLRRLETASLKNPKQYRLSYTLHRFTNVVCQLDIKVTQKAVAMTAEAYIKEFL